MMRMLRGLQRRRLQADTLTSMFLVALLVAALAAPAAPAQEGAGRLHGVVADESGGVLPGVTVIATAADGRVVATAVTDEVGRYVLRALPAPGYRLTFQLEGFADAMVDVSITSNADATIVTQRLKLAQKSETVNVHGGVRADAPAPPPRVLAPPPPAPRPVLRAVPEHDKDSICGPAKPGQAESFGTIRSGRAAAGHALYSEGEELFIDGEKAGGLEVGQNFVARRGYRTSAGPDGVAGEHTSGLLQIVAADGYAAKAIVIYACDELMRGDRLAPFLPEPLRAPEPNGIPA